MCYTDQLDFVVKALLTETEAVSDLNNKTW